MQGQTIEKPLKVSFEVMRIFEEAQGYVMLSRAQQLNQIYIIDDFDKIYPSAKALKELERMNSVSINANPSIWNRSGTDAIKIMFMNCAGMIPHYEDIKADYRLKRADMINLIETSLLDEHKEEEFSLSGYSENFIKMGRGKGIASFYKANEFRRDEKIASEKYQVIKFKHDALDIICIYRSQICDSSRLMNDLGKLIDKNRINLVMGDFNPI